MTNLKCQPKTLTDGVVSVDFLVTC